MRKAVRLAILVSVTAGALWAGLFLRPDVRAREARFESCAENLSANCLADLAVETGLAGAPPSSSSNGIRILQLLGKDAGALALVQRSLDLGNTPDIPGLGGAEAYLAPVRIARALDQGMTPAEAYSKTPGARYLHLTHALFLLREPPFGTGRHTDPLSEREHEQTAQTAAFLEALAESLQPGWKKHALEMAMELNLKLGDLASVRRLFDRIDWGDDWHGILPEGIIAVVGVDKALSNCGTKPDCQIDIYRRAALVEDSPAEAERMLRVAFDHYRRLEPWPDFGEMEEVIGLALTVGDRPLALALARELGQLAQTRTGVFPSFPHIAAARALLASGGDLQDVGAALDQAEAEMPGSGDSVIGLGHMGPITWGGGIGSQARWEQATLRARLGDADRAIRLMEGIDDAAHAWGEVLGSDLPPDMLDRLLVAARGDLSDGELLRLRARLAGRLLAGNASPAEKAGAAAEAREVFAEVDFGDDLAVGVCSQLADVGDKAGDADLRRQALECVGQAALQSRDAAQLLEAAGLWFDYESTAP